MGRRSNEEWKRLIEEQESTGESQAQYCAERGIPLSSFRWRKERNSKRRAPYVSVYVPVKEEANKSHEATLTLPGGVVFQMRW